MRRRTFWVALLWSGLCVAGGLTHHAAPGSCSVWQLCCPVFCGLLSLLPPTVPRDSIPSFLIWLYWISPVQYAYSALLVNEFRGVRFLVGLVGRGGEGEMAFVLASPAMVWTACAGIASLTVHCLVFVFSGRSAVLFSMVFVFSFSHS